MSRQRIIVTALGRLMAAGRKGPSGGGRARRAHHCKAITRREAAGRKEIVPTVAAGRCESGDRSSRLTTVGSWIRMIRTPIDSVDRRRRVLASEQFKVSGDENNVLCGLGTAGSG